MPIPIGVQDTKELREKYFNIIITRLEKYCDQKIISNKYDGFFPTDKKFLIALPGIGEYTSSAIMAIAFDRKSNVIDGNVERVFSRFYAVEKPVEESKIFINKIAEKHLPDQRYGDYAQALMDLGSLICIPKSPRCSMCPLLLLCDVGGTTRAKQFPIKLPKKDLIYLDFYSISSLPKKISLL